MTYQQTIRTKSLVKILCVAGGSLTIGMTVHSSTIGFAVFFFSMLYTIIKSEES